jgi:uncharacterized protein with NRDE domain
MIHKLLEEYPLIALHNRYLGLNTLESPPRKIGNGVYSPIDRESQGTWIGFNHDGLFLSITNQETNPIDNPQRSRGLLALDILRECSTSKEAKNYLMNPIIRPLYRPGNFIVADKRSAWHVLWDHVTVAWRLMPGPYAVGVVTMYPGIEMSERAEKIGPDSEKRRRRAFQLLNGFQPETVNDAINKMMEVSTDHAHGKSTASICWHSDEFRQTSSTIMAVGSNPEHSHVFYCPGNACEKPFEEYKVSFN